MCVVREGHEGRGLVDNVSTKYNNLAGENHGHVSSDMTVGMVQRRRTDTTSSCMICLGGKSVLDGVGTWLEAVCSLLERFYSVQEGAILCKSSETPTACRSITVR